MYEDWDIKIIKCIDVVIESEQV